MLHKILTIISILLFSIAYGQDATPDKQLCNATEKKEYEGAKTAIENGANVNCKCSRSYSYRKVATYIPIVKHFYKNKYRTVSYTEPPIVTAVSNNDIAIVKLLVSNGADIDIENSQNLSAMGAAIDNESVEIVKFLIEKGVSLTKQDYVYKAIKKENINLVKILVENGAEINGDQISAKNPTSPLVYALGSGQKGIFTYLLDKGASYTTIDSEYRSLLHLAVAKSDYFMAQNVLDKGLDINIMIGESSFRYNDVSYLNKSAPIHIAVKSGNIKMLKWLADRGADINLKDGGKKTPLLVAIEENKIPIVNQLLEFGADIDTEDNEFIYEATSNGNFNLVKTLVGNGVTFSANNNHSAVVKSLAMRRIDIFNYLLEHGGNIAENDFIEDNCWAVAIKQNNKPLALKLKQLGLDVNQKFKNEKTALHFAVKRKNKSMILWLHKNNANEYIKDNRGYTSFDYVVNYPNRDMINYLLSIGFKPKPLNLNVFPSSKATDEYLSYLKNKGLKINEDLTQLIKNNKNKELKTKLTDGHDPNFKPYLFIAVDADNTDALVLLLENAANPNKPGRFQEKLIHYTISNKKLQMLKLLVDYGVDINTLDKRNRTPLMIALEKQNIEAAEFLLKNGAKGKVNNSTIRKFVYNKNNNLLNLLIDNDLIDKQNIDIMPDLLSYSVTNSQYTIIEKLANNDIDLNVASLPYGCLIAAIKASDWQMFDILLSYDIDVTKIDHNDNAAIHLLLSTESLEKETINELVKKLLEHNIDINSQNNDGLTLLMIAIEKNNMIVFDILLAKNVKLNLQSDQYRKTALHIAIEQKNNNAIKKLVENGAQLNLANKQGKIAWKYAKKLKLDKEIVGYLKAETKKRVSN